jgi:hypothetical protein
MEKLFKWTILIQIFVILFTVTVINLAASEDGEAYCLKNCLPLLRGSEACVGGCYAEADGEDEFHGWIYLCQGYIDGYCQPTYCKEAIQECYTDAGNTGCWYEE